MICENNNGSIKIHFGQALAGRPFNRIIITFSELYDFIREHGEVKAMEYIKSLHTRISVYGEVVIVSKID